ncbi:MAG: 16S rRNA (adenine(1518)-N(6)/adenine(1519)-N(6))-dimethyltransferase RsmA [Pseudomonadota bacterium]|nr:16S rRNA (adenine(1518)-N(6)/adenine(1519)-N(6))-dimethyltransferase RsmA [Pseudomonadota bacterium]MDO7666788.1 16S rRNA (adenine(1518)-N(6)/adenine(1519)-N(6))-dimethyltransferase RsmA [Pseudomonadota bacterium]MDO7710687.1 16S rRNA (adenine(1518)-N(6)/adenine(1519)-N(6))-dimethyltransferase RsmA [Pseudomonadota bacterium]
MSDKRYPKARKRFGQNFLQDQSVIDDIVAAFDPQPGQHLIEIGPGRAALTIPLLQQGDQLDVVELDRDLVPLLEARLAIYPHLTIHQADALTFNFRSLQNQQEKLRIIGNLPYNITTPLLFHLLDQSDCIEDMFFMLQREVVERICAQPGTKRYGRLSIMVQYRCQAELLFIVPPEAFDPIPKVESAIIYLHPLAERIGGNVDIQALGQVVTQAFSQRRKTIANTLKNLVGLDILLASGIDLEQRPETITVVQYVEITRTWLESTKD